MLQKPFILKTIVFSNFKKSSYVMLHIVFTVQRYLVVGKVSSAWLLAMRDLLKRHVLDFDQFAVQCYRLLGWPTRTHSPCGHTPIWRKEDSNYLMGFSSRVPAEVTLRHGERIKWSAQLLPHVVCWYTLKILFLHVFLSFIFPRFWWKNLFFLVFDEAFHGNRSFPRRKKKHDFASLHTPFCRV